MREKSICYLLLILHRWPLDCLGCGTPNIYNRSKGLPDILLKRFVYWFAFILFSMVDLEHAHDAGKWWIRFTRKFTKRLKDAGRGQTGERTNLCSPKVCWIHKTSSQRLVIVSYAAALPYALFRIADRTPSSCRCPAIRIQTSWTEHGE